MSRRYHTFRRLSALALVATVIACNVGSAFAQANSKAEPTPEQKKGYTLPYFFTGVVVLAVVIPMCWPALRRWDVPLKEE